MKHTTGPRRGRPRGNGKRFSSGKNHNIESNGPDVKIRGTAQQVHDKYLSLARDALVSGDRIGAEGYFQYADHYYRVVSAANGNAVNRQDRNNRIPPPPDQNAGKIVLENGDTAGREEAARPSVEAVARKGEDVASTEPAQEQPAVVDVPIVDAGSDAATAEPVAAGNDGPSESQAEELAQALAKADPDAPETGAQTEAAEPVQPDMLSAPEAGSGEAQPKRRRRSPLGIGPKRSPRRRQPKAEATDAGDATEGPAKTIRRRARKTPAEAVENT
ncbi:MAG: DUF4167 domain-containing protein [Rhodospirillales bacterium]|nr:DUF4167 domain-containing protein [Rhodospirillales bacterium]